MVKVMGNTLDNTTAIPGNIQLPQNILENHRSMTGEMVLYRYAIYQQILRDIGSIAEVEDGIGENGIKFKKTGSSGSLIFEFGDDEKNEKKLAEHIDKYFYLQHEVENQ